jgi:hypothetical protein
VRVVLTIGMARGGIGCVVRSHTSSPSNDKSGTRLTDRLIDCGVVVVIVGSP